ncbi:MAG: hypothetical protein BWY22_02537 [Bacteroidetes bacterium ADurb.Bin217]|nr:MAG: hypothetical protein BWY22_02537 [Bacteroidetes bacterium ADurb.Bin217]
MTNKLRAILDFKQGDIIHYDDGINVSDILIESIHVPQIGYNITVYMQNLKDKSKFNIEGYELPLQYKL